MTGPMHSGDRIPPNTEHCAYMTAIPAPVSSPRPRRLAVLLLAGVATVAVLGAGVSIGVAMKGSPGSPSTTNAAGAPAGVPPVASSSPVPSASPSPSASVSSSRSVSAAPSEPTFNPAVAWDPITSEPTKLVGPVLLNTQKDQAAIPGGKYYQDYQMVKVPTGKWRVGAPKSRKHDCFVTVIDLPYRDVQDVAIYSPGNYQDLPFGADDMGIVLSKDCEATLEMAIAQDD
jgi:hypothetical protein